MNLPSLLAHHIKCFKLDEGGNFSMVWGFVVTLLVLAVGVGYDYSQLTHAQNKGQSIADQAALQAAIFVKNNNRLPNSSSEGFVHGQAVTAKSLGHSFTGLVHEGAAGVDVKVLYDDVNKEATAYVEGKTVPAFMQVFNYSNLDFKSKSVVKYYEVDVKDPASVTLVLDNSGSMGWDDKPLYYNSDNGYYYHQTGAQPRITGLENSVNTFMATLKNLVGEQTADSQKVLRTGMLAYSSNTISNRTVYMDWQTLDKDAHIDPMVANGGTNSAPPMDTARNWMSGENTHHTQKHGKTPLKFVIFMTDGVNTVGGYSWVQETGSEYWRRWSCNNGCGYRHRSQTNSPGYEWEEGKYQPTANISTETDCTAMKNDGVKIYSIGFALEPGWYRENAYDSNGRMKYRYISQETRDQAYSFLASCASSPHTFLPAADSAALNEAFRTIGSDIVTEIIRIDS